MGASDAWEEGGGGRGREEGGRGERKGGGNPEVVGGNFGFSPAGTQLFFFVDWR